MKVKRSKELLVTLTSLDALGIRSKRISDLTTRSLHPETKMPSVYSEVAGSIDSNPLSLTEAYRNLFNFAISYQSDWCKKVGICLSIHSLKSFEQSMLELIQIGQDANIAPEDLKRMIIKNAQSYTDWDAQPELEQCNSQMVGRSKFQRIG